jgi:hypothetical protein
VNKLLLILVVACCTLAALPAAAMAGESFSSDGLGGSGSPAVLPDPNGLSAGDQYVETLPTTRGPRAPGRGRRAKLPAAVEHRLRALGGGDASTLRDVATSPSYGAPAASPGPGKNSARHVRGHHRAKSALAVPSAAIGAAGGGEAGLGWLVLAILAITALALGAVAYQRRANRPRPD